MPSRRKMCLKLLITVVVPAPEEPVMATIGCFTDMSSSALVLVLEQRPLFEEGGTVGLVLATVEGQVIAGDLLHLLA